MRRQFTLALILGLASVIPVAATAATPTKQPVVATKQPVVATKQPVVATKKYVPRKKVPVKPSPTPTIWPPKGFQSNNGVYAKFPTENELVSLLSAKTTLAFNVKQCKVFACGAVYISSITPCVWWEINSKVFGPNPADVTEQIEYGSLRTLIAGTKAKQVLPIILVSGETLFPHEAIILQVLGITHDAFFSQIAAGKSLTQIAGKKINMIVVAFTAEENRLINAQQAAGTISPALAQAMRESTAARIGTELTSYDLSVGGITISCWTIDPTTPVPNITYTQNPNHF